MKQRFGMTLLGFVILAAASNCSSQTENKVDKAVISFGPFTANTDYKSFKISGENIILTGRYVLRNSVFPVLESDGKEYDIVTPGIKDFDIENGQEIKVTGFLISKDFVYSGEKNKDETSNVLFIKELELDGKIYVFPKKRKTLLLPEYTRELRYFLMNKPPIPLTNRLKTLNKMQ